MGDEVSVVPAGETKAESIDLFAEVLDFPDWFGRNLDALADCLHDLAEEPREDGGACVTSSGTAWRTCAATTPRATTTSAGCWPRSAPTTTRSW